jgi:hypothetical protein
MRFRLRDGVSHLLELELHDAADRHTRTMLLGVEVESRGDVRTSPVMRHPPIGPPSR